MVNYADPDETSPPGNVWHPVTEALRKRWWYEYEKEIRLIYHLHSNNGLPNPASKGILRLNSKEYGFRATCQRRFQQSS